MRKCFIEKNGNCKYQEGGLCQATRFRRANCIYRRREDHEKIDRARQLYKLKCQDFKDEVRQYFENYQPRKI